MTVPSLPTRVADQAVHRQRIAETVNDILAYRSDAWRRPTPRETQAGVTVVHPDYPPGHILRYRDLVSGTTDATATIQLAADVNSEVIIPDGDWITSGTVNFNDGQSFLFQSRNAVIKGDFAGAIIKGKDAASTRRYRMSMWSGKLDGVDKTNAGGIGLDLYAASMCKVYGTEITNVATGVRLLGSGALGCFYNDLFGVDIITVTTGYSLGDLGNDNKVFGGRVNDCTDGVVNDDNSGNIFNGLAVEAFTGDGFDIGSSAASQYIRIINPRLENSGGVGTGIRVGSLAQSTLILEPQCVGLSANISDSGVDTLLIGTDKATDVMRIKTVKLASAAFGTSINAMLYADSSALIRARNGIDSGYADVDMRDAIVRGQVQVQGTSAKIYAGSGSPEGAVSANIGSIYLRTDGGASTTLYVKESGAGNTGWIAK